MLHYQAWCNPLSVLLTALCYLQFGRLSQFSGPHVLLKLVAFVSARARTGDLSRVRRT